MARLRARHFGSMKALRSAAVEEIGRVRGVGDAIAQTVVGFFEEAKNRRLLDRLEKLGLNFQEPTAAEGEVDICFECAASHRVDLIVRRQLRKAPARLVLAEHLKRAQLCVCAVVKFEADCSGP